MSGRTAQDWERLDAIFREALEKYPYSKFALHHLWNTAIATGPETLKPPPAPPLMRDLVGSPAPLNTDD